MNKELKNYIKDIAKIHQCTVRFIPNSLGGRYHNSHIDIGIKMTNREIIQIFCHELAHHKNTIEGKHKVYHKICNASKGVELYGNKRFADILIMHLRRLLLLLIQTI